jgi:hypothetical protein
MKPATIDRQAATFPGAIVGAGLPGRTSSSCRLHRLAAQSPRHRCVRLTSVASVPRTVTEDIIALVHPLRRADSSAKWPPTLHVERCRGLHY